MTPTARVRRVRRRRPRHGGPALARAVALAGAALCVLAGCTAPARPPGAAGAPAVLYVASTGDATLTRLDAASGRVLGPPLPAGPGPVQVAVGPGGAALVLAGEPADAAAPGLTYVARAGRGWTTRPVPLEPGARAVLLAADGGDYAAVVYLLPAGGPPRPGATGDGAGRRGAGEVPDPAPVPGPACGLALIDLRVGAVEAASPVCTPRELPTGLTLERTAAGPVASLALWHRATAAAGAFLPAGARLVRVAARTGAPLAAALLRGLPRPAAAGGSLVLAPGPDGAHRLYAVEALPGSQLATWGAAEYGWQFALSGAWRLHRLTPDTLESEAEVRLAFAPLGLAVAPDGAHAYAFDARGDGLLRIDLATGHTAELARVPGRGPWGLAATPARLYAASPADGQVWAFDRQRGQRVQVLRVGRAPAGISPAP